MYRQWSRGMPRIPRMKDIALGIIFIYTSTRAGTWREMKGGDAVRCNHGVTSTLSMFHLWLAWMTNPCKIKLTSISRSLTFHQSSPSISGDLGLGSIHVSSTLHCPTYSSKEQVKDKEKRLSKHSTTVPLASLLDKDRSSPVIFCILPQKWHFWPLVLGFFGM